MSFSAIKWAMAQQVSKSSAKFVLVAMADCVNGDGENMVCWPSIQHLADATAQDRKTVIDNIRRLRESGHIVDTKERKGVTGQVPVYLLNTPETGTVKELKKDVETVPVSLANSTESGTVEQIETVPFFPINSPVFPYQQSRFSLSTVPKTGHGTRKEPVIEPVRNKEKKANVCATIEIPDGLLADFLSVRKAKRAGPLTETAIAGLQREASKAGLTLEQAVTACCEFGWQGFNASWYAERQAKGQIKPMAGRHAGFEKQNYHESL